MIMAGISSDGKKKRKTNSSPTADIQFSNFRPGRDSWSKDSRSPRRRSRKHTIKGGPDVGCLQSKPFFQGAHVKRGVFGYVRHCFVRCDGWHNQCFIYSHSLGEMLYRG